MKYIELKKLRLINQIKKYQEQEKYIKNNIKNSTDELLKVNQQIEFKKCMSSKSICKVCGNNFNWYSSDFNGSDDYCYKCSKIVSAIEILNSNICTAYLKVDWINGEYFISMRDREKCEEISNE